MIRIRYGLGIGKCGEDHDDLDGVEIEIRSERWSDKALARKRLHEIVDNLFSLYDSFEETATSEKKK